MYVKICRFSKKVVNLLRKKTKKVAKQKCRQLLSFRNPVFLFYEQLFLLI